MQQPHPKRPDSGLPPLPARVRAKLVAYRKELIRSKGMEAAFIAASALLLSLVIVFVADRLGDTPTWLRWIALIAGVSGFVVVLPIQFFRWPAKHRTLLSVAQRVAREDIRVGDSLLSVMELTHDKQEFDRSPALAMAAIQSGDEALSRHTIGHTLPKSLHRAWGAVAALLVLTIGVGAAQVPGAAHNAFLRWLMPAGSVERYTFTRLEEVPGEQVVARLEEFQVKLNLAEDSINQPETGILILAGGETLSADLVEGAYRFDLQGLQQSKLAQFEIGDWRASCDLVPVDRAEVVHAQASVHLPSYLELPEPIVSDARAGHVSVVEGARVSLELELTRDLSVGTSSAGDVVLEGATLAAASWLAEGGDPVVFEWRDEFGLKGPVPFELSVRTRPDGKPTTMIEGLRSNTILLFDQATLFRVRSNDDFGVRRVGLEWKSYGEEQIGEPGEKVLGLGDPGARDLELQASLHPKNMGIEPQVLSVRAFVLDALPGRERSFSTPVVVQVMTSEQHMIYLTRALGAWHDQAVEVRDQEHNLLQTNEGLMGQLADEGVTAQLQRKIQSQASAERQNRRRLNGLVRSGKDLLREAARNEEFNSNNLDDWAEMMAALESIAESRMPKVAELLDKAARAEKPKPAPVAGLNRESAQPDKEPESKDEDKASLPNAPQVTDVESSFNDSKTANAESESEAKAPGPPAPLGLVQTEVQGGGADCPPEEADDSPAPEAEGPTADELAKALAEQRALLEEFQKVTGKINEILADLEGSTFVKRLKSLSRAQTGVARELDDFLVQSFGSNGPSPEPSSVLEKVGVVQETSGQRASLVREDLAAYVERLKDSERDVKKYQTVHDEMGDVGVTREMAAIASLASVRHTGEAMAGAENLADDLDRWAEILVGPG